MGHLNLLLTQQERKSYSPVEEDVRICVVAVSRRSSGVSCPTDGIHDLLRQEVYRRPDGDGDLGFLMW